MLKGKELGDAIRAALQQNGKTPAEAARYFNVKPPSVSGWMSTGRISKGNFNKLMHWLDKTPIEHWGLNDHHRPSNSAWTAEEPIRAYAAQTPSTATPIPLSQAVARIAEHLTSLGDYDVETAKLLLSTLAQDPRMPDVVTAGLLGLKPPRTATKHQTPAENERAPRAA